MKVINNIEGASFVIFSSNQTRNCIKKFTVAGRSHVFPKRFGFLEIQTRIRTTKLVESLIKFKVCYLFGVFEARNYTEWCVERWKFYETNSRSGLKIRHFALHNDQNFLQFEKFIHS